MSRSFKFVEKEFLFKWWLTNLVENTRGIFNFVMDTNNFMFLQAWYILYR